MISVKSIILKSLSIYFRKKKKLFLTTHTRPVLAHDYDLVPDYSLGFCVCIIVQGNLMYEDDFTFETIKLYRKLYPSSTIVLSTWDDEDESMITRIKLLGCHVIQSSKPNLPGHGNLNFQIYSTNAGIKYAEKIGAQYVLKTRTDQRICAPQSLTFLLNTLKNYPISLKRDDIGRLVVMSNGCFSNRLYNVTDMLLFGKLSDIRNYFSAPYDNRYKVDYSQENQIEYSKNRPGEIYLSTHYIERLGFELQWTKSDSEFYFRELFVVVDSESLDFFWPKYTDHEYRWRRYINNKMSQLTYRDWLRLYMQTRR